jgi:hypothetical protein
MKGIIFAKAPTTELFSLEKRCKIDALSFVVDAKTYARTDYG